MSNEQEMREAFVEFWFTGMSDEYKDRHRDGFWLTCNWTSYKEKDWKTWHAATLAAEARIRELEADAERLSYVYSGQRTTSDSMVAIELRLLNDDIPTIEEVRDAIDRARKQSKENQG